LLKALNLPEKGSTSVRLRLPYRKDKKHRSPSGFLLHLTHCLSDNKMERFIDAERSILGSMKSQFAGNIELIISRYLKQLF